MDEAEGFPCTISDDIGSCCRCGITDMVDSMWNMGYGGYLLCDDCYQEDLEECYE